MIRHVLAVALLAFVFATNGQFTGFETGKSFKLVDFYSGQGGAQKKKSMLTATSGRILTNDIVYLVNPRIEHFREDGSLVGIATAQDALVNLLTHTATGTNMVSFRNAEENLFVAGKGFLWQQTNSVLIIYNQSYTWIDRTVFTNSASRK